jgi:hypothetical protein
VAAPQFVPNTLDEQPRRGLEIPPAERWVPERPGELGAAQPIGKQLGNQGPDQGFALHLAHQFEPRLVVVPPERIDDAVAGCLGVALARASRFGRAPVVHDLDIAFRIWGFLGDAPPELIALRQPRFEAVAHRYTEQRAIVDQVPMSTLELPPGDVARRFPSEWRELLGL